MGFLDRFRRRSRVETAFLRTRRAALGQNPPPAGFVEACSSGAQAAALDLIHVRNAAAGEVARALSGISTDALMFEAVAWFLSSVQTFVRRSPEVVDDMRPLLHARLQSAIAGLGAVFQREAGYPGDLLERRTDAFPEPLQEAVGFFWAALMEDRGREVPVALVQGGPLPLNIADGIVLPMLATNFCTAALAPRLHRLYDTMKAVENPTLRANAFGGDEEQPTSFDPHVLTTSKRRSPPGSPSTHAPPSSPCRPRSRATRAPPRCNSGGSPSIRFGA